MKCYFCGKIPIMGRSRKKLRGKYNPTEKTRKHPNLQWTKLTSGKRVKACTKCIRTRTKEK
ncbi:MAG: L28 family ribosomal protein [Candidatus Paceibacterota bacterium]